MAVKRKRETTPGTRTVKTETPSKTPKPDPETPSLDVDEKKPLDDQKLDGRSPSALAKIKKLGDPTSSPFPEYERPSREECRLVCDALASVHGMPKRPAELKDSDHRGASCGQVPDVLDALIRTILSQNTSNANSARAKKGLDDTFGRGNYEAIRRAEVEDVADAIKNGGLANVKSKVIKKVLDSVFDKRGEISLDYLHSRPDREAMEELVSFDGVGPKTASCVLLFCLGRESFAVDTHVFRITKSLGWTPARADRETAHRHLDVRIPDELKYPLHSLLVRHGRGCRHCSATGKTMDRDAFEGDCPIKSFMRGKPRPKEVEEKGAVDESGEVAFQTPTKKQKTVKQAEVAEKRRSSRKS